MAETGGFKHISVTSDVDDDIVIHAGVKRPQAAGDVATQDATSSKDVAVQDDVQPQQHTSQDAGQARSDETAPARAEDEGKASREASQSMVARDGYRETTLDDLKSAPMSSMQKGIIVFAVLAIAVAVVYYMMFMR